MLSKQKWSLLSHELGEEWTIEKLLQIREQVENNTLLPTPTNLNGCTEKPLFDAVPISNYIVPVLHLLVGIGNILVDSIFEWVEERVETLTPEEVVARNNILSDNINTENATQEFNLWLENDGIRLTDFILEKRTIQQQLKEKDGKNQLIIRDAARRRELNARNKELIAEVKQLQSAKKQHGDRVKALRKILREMEKRKKELEANIGKLSRPIWAQIEEKCFVKFGIDRPYYHEGK